METRQGYEWLQSQGVQRTPLGAPWGVRGEGWSSQCEPTAALARVWNAVKDSARIRAALQGSTIFIPGHRCQGLIRPCFFAQDALPPKRSLRRTGGSGVESVQAKLLAEGRTRRCTEEPEHTATRSSVGHSAMLCTGCFHTPCQARSMPPSLSAEEASELASELEAPSMFMHAGTGLHQIRMCTQRHTAGISILFWWLISPACGRYSMAQNPQQTPPEPGSSFPVGVDIPLHVDLSEDHAYTSMHCG